MFDQISASLQRAQDSVQRRVNSIRNRDALEGSSTSRRGSRDAPEASTSAAAPDPAVPAYSYDVAIRFIGASGLPGLDINGQSDPYVVANLDDRIEFKSSVRQETLTPIWNEQWFVKNVPDTATLHVRVFDKDDNARDDFIGQFKTPLREGAQECRLDSENGAQRGTLWFEVKLTASIVPDSAQYCFDGPVSFSRHISAALGRFAGTKGSGLEDKAAFFASALPAMTSSAEPSPMPTSTSSSKPVSSAERLRRHAYCTWKIHLKGVALFFGDKQQHWLESYPAAQKIFTGPVLLRTSIRTAHRLLYARTSLNEFGIITDADTLWRELAPQERSAITDTASPARESSPPGRPRNKSTWLVKPVLYTYIIGVDDRWRFSETGAAFFTDFASKHALHACVNDYVRYAGEFHPRPCVEGGWAGLDGKLPPADCEWELWIDNASGTYGPDPKLLPKLKETLEYNFPGLKVEAFDFKDEVLAKSKADMLAYARSKPGMVPTPTQLADGVQQLDLAANGSEPVSAANGTGGALTATERDLLTLG